MHGNAEQSRHLDPDAPAPAMQNVLRPSIELLEKIHRSGRNELDAAVSFGVPLKEFLRWKRNIKVIMAMRPDALVCLRHLRDLREAGDKPPCVLPADVLRRERSLSRAEALAKRMPVWPGCDAVVPFSPLLDGAHDRKNGWHRDGDGVAVRGKKVKGKVDNADRDDDEPEPRRRGRPPRIPYPMKPTVEFPKVLAAALAQEASQFSLGDALIEETGEPPKGGTGPDGSYIKLDKARVCLLKNGVDYSSNYLRKIRNVAFIFRPSTRRTVSFCMHQEAGNPETLDACIASLPKGQKLDVDFVQAFVRSRRPPRPAKEAPPDKLDAIAVAVKTLVGVLKMQTRASRVAVVAGLMKALGIGVGDLGSGPAACRLLSRPAPLAGETVVRLAAAG